MMGKENFPSVRSSQKLLFSAYFWVGQGVANKCMSGISPSLPLLGAASTCLRGLKVAVVITDLEVEPQTIQERVEVAAEREPISQSESQLGQVHEGSHQVLSLKSCMRSTARRNRPPVSTASRRN